jgi:hypothetical protein
MGVAKSDLTEAMSNHLSNLYVGLEDFVAEGSAESLLKLLALVQNLRIAMDIFDRSAVEVLRRHDVSWSEVASTLGGTPDDVLQRFRLSERTQNCRGASRNLADSERPSGAKVLSSTPAIPVAVGRASYFFAQPRKNHSVTFLQNDSK